MEGLASHTPDENQKTKKEKVYETITELYGYVMNDMSNTINWTGYNASIGFPVEGIGYYEPSLQRLLSLLHKNRREPNFLNLVQASVKALKEFDYTKEVAPEFQKKFLECGSLEVIQKVTHDLEQSLQK